MTATDAEGHYFDIAAVIVTLILVGKVLEARARASAGDAARTLLERGAKEATLLDGEVERRVPIEELLPGNVVVVVPGEKIPADGVVQDGVSWVDLSLLTGESVPVDVGPGSEVVGASINGHGRLTVFVTKVGANTKLSEIVRLLETAQGSRAPVQRLADRISSIFVPAVMLVAVATFVGWLVVGNAEPGQALLNAVAVLLIACPCALGLATPAAIMAGTGRGAELGILFKGGEVFETAHAADIVLLDKTGTVTEGAMASPSRSAGGLRRGGGPGDGRCRGVRLRAPRRARRRRRRANARIDIPAAEATDRSNRAPAPRHVVGGHEVSVGRPEASTGRSRRAMDGSRRRG